MSSESNTEIPKTRTAWLFQKNGYPQDALVFKESYPMPSLGAGSILVKTRAVALNPVGYKLYTYAPMAMLSKKPSVPEMDWSGTVTALGKGVKNFKVGDEVYGNIPIPAVLRNGQGALSTYIVTEASLALHKPAALNFEDAAAIPMTALTAWQMMEEGGVQKGDRVFINGGSGGTGVMAIQFAKAAGAIVTTTCSERSRDLVRNQLGADEVIDYSSVDLPSYLASLPPSSHFTFICDCNGSDALYHASPKFLQPGPRARYLDITGPQGVGPVGFIAFLAERYLRPSWLGGTKTPYKMVMYKPSVEDLTKIGHPIEEGKVKAITDSVHAFTDVKAAYEKQISGRAKGKVVVQVSK